MNISASMNMAFGVRDGAHVMTNVNLGVAAYETLCLVCAEHNVDLDQVTETDFYSAAQLLDEFCNGADEQTGYTVSVWFDM